MSDEERQRQMDFIVAALARLTASTEAETQANRERAAQQDERAAQQAERAAQEDKRAAQQAERAVQEDKRAAQNSKSMDRLERVLKLTIRAGRRRFREHDERINALIESQVGTLEITRRNSEAIDSQAERSREQDERISAFVKSIERLVETMQQSAAEQNNGGGGNVQT